MALIKCPDCRKELSDKADKCPNCGYPIAEQIKKEEKVQGANDKRTGCLIFIGIILIAIVVNLCSGRGESTNKVTSESYSPPSYCITQQTVGTYTESDYDKLTRYAVNKELTLFQQMILDGRAVVLEKGTKVLLEDGGFTVSEIRFPNQPESIWIASEFVGTCY